VIRVPLLRSGKKRSFMAEMANPVRHEFWQPPATDVGAGQERSATCEECRTEFLVGSRYCHSCGATRPMVSGLAAAGVPGLAEFTSVGKHLGLATPSLIAFLLGAFCLVAALSVGVFFTAHTALEWQAVQLWRIEWLLAGIAAFAAGLLLKKSS